MNAVHASGGGCGSGACQCAGSAAPAAPVPSINGISLHGPAEVVDPEALQERAWGELLRQEAVRQGLLPRNPALVSPLLGESDMRVIEQMVDKAVPLATPGEAECRRYYDANKPRFTWGLKVRLRHILFAVTDGVDVSALAARAEKALLELTRKDAPPERFGELARELSNCPSSAEGGDLGWIGPQDCAEELASELFFRSGQGLGLLPRLIHSRFGLHIAEVLERCQGSELAFEDVRERIAMELAQRSRATALHQYVRILAGVALVEGIDLEGAGSPLVQ